MLLSLARQELRAIEDFEGAVQRPLVNDGWLIDLRRRHDATGVVEAALPLIQRHLGEGALQLDFADGWVATWRSKHRWRFWRRG